MDYNRMTIKDEEYGNYVQNKEGSVLVSFSGKIHGTIIDKLAEIEDKIEQGLMIELPCKVGDTIYRAKRFYGGYWIDVNTIVKCEIFEVSIRFYDDNDNEFDIEQIGKSVFLTKAEAEAKLRELQGDRE